MFMNRAYRRAYAKARVCMERVTKIPAGVRSKVAPAHLDQALDRHALKMDGVGRLLAA